MMDHAFNTTIRRRRWLGLVGVWFSVGVGAQSGHTSLTLPTPQSLQAELDKALRQKEPLIVMVSLEGCPFCRVARQSHLVPMQKAGSPIVQLDMRSAQTVIDFQGQSTTHDQLIQKWRISIAPTLLFLAPGVKKWPREWKGVICPIFMVLTWMNAYSKDVRQFELNF